MAARTKTHVARDMAWSLCGRLLDEVRAFGWIDEYQRWYSDPDRDTNLRWCGDCTERYWQRTLKRHTDQTKGEQ